MNFIIFIALFLLLLFGFYISFRNDLKLKVECISMYSDNKRRDNLLNHIKMVGFDSCDFSFFNAIKPKTLSNKYKEYTQSVKDTRLACWQSHVDVWKKYKDFKEPILVLEDDVRFIKDFPGKLNNILDVLKNIEWDMCFLGRKEVEDDDNNIPLNTCDLEIVKNNFFETHCYLFNPNKLIRLLQCDISNVNLDNVTTTLAKENKNLAIDTYISYLMKQNKLNIIGVKNQLAEQISTEAGIFSILDNYQSTTS